MIHFYRSGNGTVYSVCTHTPLSDADHEKLVWLFDGASLLSQDTVAGRFIGPRAAMITPWSTNAVEITQNMGIDGITRIETFTPKDLLEDDFDNMLFQEYDGLNQDVFFISHTPEPVLEIHDIAQYNLSEGLSLNDDEVTFLIALSEKLGRPLTDSEVFGFSQVNSEHCRHKIFNGKYTIDGVEKEASLFGLIKNTSRKNPENLVSAYKDNVAFIKGPEAVQFSPAKGDVPSVYCKKTFESVLSLKAETHNFPTTVEPFNGAATGSGGEIRDRLAGGKGSIPLAGTAVYMTSYPRLNAERRWEFASPERKWLYQNPEQILIKASNGASDFGNKFGQPLICGSLLTFEHAENHKTMGYDKVIMLAGGIGYGKLSQSEKEKPEKGDKIVVLGGDNYRIGMGGAAVSSADTGAFGSGIELNAVQRSNPEMQKRVANAIRALVEQDENPIVSIHDHGAGGHLNCLSELVEKEGGCIRLDALPVGDPTLSAKEIIGNESQERMGLVIKQEDMGLLQRIADRERAPMFDVGEITGDHRFVVHSERQNLRSIDLAMDDLFGTAPQTRIHDVTIAHSYKDVAWEAHRWMEYLEQVLQLEAVACKDWLTNKVDRCVGGRVAKQQCTGPLQLPLNNCGVMALDFEGLNGIATSVGHAPVSGLVHAGAASRLSIAEALTNIVWAPLEKGLKSVSLSANWMWPCKNPGEDARLYEAVEACADFAIRLGINIPTGKDSLSMTQKYPDKQVMAPGTVIISAAAHCNNINKVVEPVLKSGEGELFYLNLSFISLDPGGSSFAQVIGSIGHTVPDVQNPEKFALAFDIIQSLIKDGGIAAGHDIGSGGLITTLLEMCFSDPSAGATLDVSALNEPDIIKLFFSENPGIVFQAVNGFEEDIAQRFGHAGIDVYPIGKYSGGGELTITNFGETYRMDVAALRRVWFKTSYLLDTKQSGKVKAAERFGNFEKHALTYVFPEKHTGQKPVPSAKKVVAAIIREKGSNSERELAHALYLAGFEVRDVHMTDLVSGRETLEDVHFIGAVGGFSNSDVLGSAKGWAGAFRYNEKANKALMSFFERKDTLSVGICNGCQLFVALGLIHPHHPQPAKMHFNDSGKHESGFTSVDIRPNNSVMLSSMAGSRLGVWISHGEGKFLLPAEADSYGIAATYGHDTYPANPNGSDHNAAMLCSPDGRHLVMMPHIERSIFPWNWAYYPKNRNDVVSPWLEAFVNAKTWLDNNI
jgi:phosphoribosylformylglycinamidine synthase